MIKPFKLYKLLGGLTIRVRLGLPNRWRRKIMWYYFVKYYRRRKGM